MATGLLFETQTFINYNLDPDSGKGVKLFEAKKEKIDGVETDVIRIKRDFVFAKDGIKAIRTRQGYDGKYCLAWLDCEKILAEVKPAEGRAYCRLDIYLGVEGAEPYIYSTPWVQKGMPFWMEFTVKSTDTANSLAKNIVDMIKKNKLFLCDKDLLTAKVNKDGKGSIVILEGTTDYQRFKKVEVSVFDVTSEYADMVLELEDESKAIQLKERGMNSFGTYAQVVKDLRLPTAANYQWSHVRQAETPIVGAIYDQYIIEYCAPAVNDGMQAVGQRLESHTTHVFWVKLGEVSNEFMAELGKVANVVNEKNEVVAPVTKAAESELSK